jgi:hypothetical protein
MTANQYNALNKRLHKIEQAILHIDHNLDRLLGERGTPLSPLGKALPPSAPLTQQPKTK